MLALLSSIAGKGVFDVTADTDNFDTAKEKLTTHFKPTKLTRYRVYELPGETLDAFVTRLRTRARDCEFINVDNEIKAQITQKCRSSKVRRRSFLGGITLKDCQQDVC